jgi:hypothetical protein
MTDLFTFVPREPHQLTRRENPVTSLDAAVSIIPTLGELQRRVMDALDAAGAHGMTDYELEQRLGSHGSTFRTRRAELVAIGLVVNTGRKRLVKGRNRIVWALKDRGTC